MTPATLVVNWFKEVWNLANEDYIDSGMHADAIVHGLDPTGITYGIENFKIFYTNFRKSFPITKISVQVLISNDEIATGYCTVIAENEFGKEVSFNGISINKFKDNKLVESWNSFDFLKMYQQLGHILQSPIEPE